MIGLVAQAFNPSTWEAEAGRSLWVQDQPGLQNKFQVSRGYTERLCFKTKQTTTPTRKKKKKTQNEQKMNKQKKIAS